MSNGNGYTKVTVGEVFDYIEDGQWHTKKEMAEHFDVSTKTISLKIKTLQVSGFCILFGNKGSKLIDENSIDEDAAVSWERNAIWIKGTLSRLADISKPMHKRSIVTSVRKCLPSTPDDRRELRKFAVTLQRVIDAADIDEDE